MGYILPLGGSDYEEAMDLTLGIKKMACKLAKCLKEAEDMDEDPEEGYWEDDTEFRGGPRYRNEDSMDMVPSQGGNMMGNQTSMRRGRGKNGRYVSMRRKRKMMMDPMDWY